MTPVALVTGGQQGIGLGIAKALAGAGFRIVLAAELDGESGVVQDALQQLGDQASYLRHDVTDIPAIERFLDRIEVEAGSLTTFVSNAGAGAIRRGDMLDVVTPETLDHVMRVNLHGGFFLAQAIARRMLARSSGRLYRSITFVTSVSASMVSVDRADYCISKAAAAMMAQAFAVRLAPHGIGVFDLRPGVIDTAMTAGVREQYTARIEAGLVPAGRWGQPDDIGAAILPIATGKLAFATGTVVSVDGGLSISRL